MARPRNGPKPWKPFPSQLEALRAVADGSSHREAGLKIHLDPWQVGSRLSGLYDRLGITLENTPGHRLSQHRRYAAIRICKANGWWADE